MSDSLIRTHELRHALATSWLVGSTGSVAAAGGAMDGAHLAAAAAAAVVVVVVLKPACGLAVLWWIT